MEKKKGKKTKEVNKVRYKTTPHNVVPFAGLRRYKCRHSYPSQHAYVHRD